MPSFQLFSLLQLGLLILYHHIVICISIDSEERFMPVNPLIFFISSSFTSCKAKFLLDKYFAWFRFKLSFSNRSPKIASINCLLKIILSFNRAPFSPWFLHTILLLSSLALEALSLSLRVPLLIVFCFLLVITAGFVIFWYIFCHQNHW